MCAERSQLLSAKLIFENKKKDARATSAPTTCPPPPGIAEIMAFIVEILLLQDDARGCQWSDQEIVWNPSLLSWSF
jgi:hypothetical protein